MNRDLLFVTIVASLGGVIIGIDSSLLFYSYPSFKDYFDLTYSGRILTYATSISGAILGSAIIGRYLDKHGRRDMLKIAAVMFMVASLGCAFSTLYEFFLLFRLIAGFGIGIISVATPIYLSEIAPQKSRGRISLAFPLSILIGTLFGWLLNLEFVNSITDNWRWMFLCMLIPVVLFLFLLFSTVRSPRWTMRKGYDRETSFVLRLLNQQAGLEDLDLAMAEIKETFPESKVKLKKVDSFKLNDYKKMWSPLILFAIFVPFTGATFVTASMIENFKSPYVSQDLSFYSSLITGLVQIGGVLFAFGFIDKIGRKKLLLFGIVISITTLIALGVANYFSKNSIQLLIVFSEIFLFFYALSIGSLFWVLIPELLPNMLRARGVSLIITAYWAFHLLVYILSGLLGELVEKGTLFLGFAIITLIGLFFFNRKLKVESKCKSLEEIDKELIDKKPGTLSSPFTQL